MKNSIEKNIFLFYLVRALFLPFFWLPLMYYYLTSLKGLNPAQTTLLLGLQEFLLIFLELPTGVVADKISRKFSIALGYLITSLPFIFLPWVDSYWLMIVIFSVKAIGKALVSGADSAILYDTLVDLGRTNEYKNIKTKAGILTLGVAALAIFFGGLMGQYGLYNLSLWLPLPLQICGAIAAWTMVEPEVSKAAKKIQEQNYLLHIKKVVGLVFSDRKIVVLTLVFAILEGTAVNMKWYYPAIFERLEFDLWLSGMIMSLLYAGKTLTNVVGTKLINKDASLNTVIWLFFIFTAWIVSGLWMIVWLVVPMLIVILIGVELATNSTEELLHDSIKSEVRATAMSFINLTSSIAATILLLMWGGIIQQNGVSMAAIGQGLIVLVVMLFMRKVVLTTS